MRKQTVVKQANHTELAPSQVSNGVPLGMSTALEEGNYLLRFLFYHLGVRLQQCRELLRDLAVLPLNEWINARQSKLEDQRGNFGKPFGFTSVHHFPRTRSDKGPTVNQIQFVVRMAARVLEDVSESHQGRIVLSDQMMGQHIGENMKAAANELQNHEGHLGEGRMLSGRLQELEFFVHHLFELFHPQWHKTVVG